MNGDGKGNGALIAERPDQVRSQRSSHQSRHAAAALPRRDGPGPDGRGGAAAEALRADRAGGALGAAVGRRGAAAGRGGGGGGGVRGAAEAVTVEGAGGGEAVDQS